MVVMVMAKNDVDTVNNVVDVATGMMDFGFE
jgi:hypothetical protein